jgi:UDP-N-acetyl-D-galactosamine dehydrogenase
LILGWTFKEDVADVRNTRVIDIYRELRSYGVDVLVYDPEADAREVLHEYGVRLVDAPENHGSYDAVILAVKHRALLTKLTVEKVRSFGGMRAPIVVDVKGFFAPKEMDRTGLVYWRL